ncbi:MAG: hypothetical protein DRP56_04830 [Planctomycetota bacterium]|nr:MAG: hypothetical protein DRP56_04830 [Planctomycetota bacterium]
MGQTIIDEFLFNWQENEEQPDPVKFGFGSMLELLEETRRVMIDLGTSCNDLKRANRRKKQLADQQPECICGSHATIKMNKSYCCLECGETFKQEKTNV